MTKWSLPVHVQKKLNYFMDLSYIIKNIFIVWPLELQFNVNSEQISIQYSG